MAPNNRTIKINDEDKIKYLPKIVKSEKIKKESLINKTIKGKFEEYLNHISPGSVDLLVLDPPYNLSKKFGNLTFNKTSVDEYSNYLDNVIKSLLSTLSLTATVYICGDWYSSNSIFSVASKYLHVRNRITWEREKGRGAKSNWKNSSEDIWFCTVSNDYTFNVDSVKLRRKVLAPYKEAGNPKDWQETPQGNFRDTFPSNLWTDLTVPFWSMPENTDHPTQKPEKLLAKLILASSNPGDLVLDPFLGSGTTSVAAKKLGRNYIGIDMNEEYCLLAEKRLDIAETNKTIQGLKDDIFWERNSI